jgi:glycosyltransferase involved in cell wall biosynthesis
MEIGKLIQYFRGRPGFSGHKIASSLKPKSSPWGGGNQVVEQLVAYLAARGHKTAFRLTPDVTAILLVDPRPAETTMFSVAEIEAFKRSHPQVRCIHRINECDLRKGTHEVDEILRRANRVADFTVFISHWLRDYFIDRWFDPRLPHRVIQNGADPKIFYPQMDQEYTDGQVLKIVTHHWSDNWNKGFKVYGQVDRMIAQSELERFSLMVIGRWPMEIAWQAATTHPPVRGKKLANLLRQNHLYLTASLWEPCGMHHIEGAQCGLPLVYHEDGGGIVEFGRRYGVPFREDLKAALLEARGNYRSLLQKVLASPPSGDEMCKEYEAVLTQTDGMVF